MRLILDLGMQKTGSKARQQHFLREFGACTEGVIFPESGRTGGWHRPLYEALVREEWQLLDMLAAECEQALPEACVAIVSYEEFYKLDTPAIFAIRERLPGLEGVIFLRRQDQLVNSLHNQKHKSHRVPLKKLEAFESGMLEYDPAYDHRLTLERWTTVLGRKAVHPLLFYKDKSPVEAFCHAAGVALHRQGRNESRPNRAMDAEGLAVLRWVKRLASDDELLVAMNEAHRVLEKSFVSADSLETYYSMDMDARHKIMSFYESSNEWVRRHFFPERKHLFEPLEPGVRIAPDYLRGRETAEAILRAARNSLTGV